MKTRAETVILEAGQRLRGQVLSISDDIEFDNFRREMLKQHNIGIADLARNAGLDTTHVKGKYRAGIVSRFEARGIDAPEAYIPEAKPYRGKALTREEHGDPDAPDDLDAWWLENCPTKYRVYLLEKALAEHDFIGNLYRTELGREPDAAGEAFWREVWTEQFRAGIK